jgi:hypothetical protein
MALHPEETETAPATEEADTAMAGEAEEAAAEEAVVITAILPTTDTVEEAAGGDVAVQAVAEAAAEGAAGQVRATASPPVGLRVSIPRLPCSAS